MDVQVPQLKKDEERRAGGAWASGGRGAGSSWLGRLARWMRVSWLSPEGFLHGLASGKLSIAFFLLTALGMGVKANLFGMGDAVGRAWSLLGASPAKPEAASPNLDLGPVISSLHERRPGDGSRSLAYAQKGQDISLYGPGASAGGPTGGAAGQNGSADGGASGGPVNPAAYAAGLLGNMNAGGAGAGAAGGFGGQDIFRDHSAALSTSLGDRVGGILGGIGNFGRGLTNSLLGKNGNLRGVLGGVNGLAGGARKPVGGPGSVSGVAGGRIGAFSGQFNPGDMQAGGFASQGGGAGDAIGQLSQMNQAMQAAGASGTNETASQGQTDQWANSSAGGALGGARSPARQIVIRSAPGEETSKPLSTTQNNPKSNPAPNPTPKNVTEWQWAVDAANALMLASAGLMIVAFILGKTPATLGIAEGFAIAAGICAGAVMALGSVIAGAYHQLWQGLGLAAMGGFMLYAAIRATQTIVNARQALQAALPQANLIRGALNASSSDIAKQAGQALKKDAVMDGVIGGLGALTTTGLSLAPSVDPSAAQAASNAAGGAAPNAGNAGPNAPSNNAAQQAQTDGNDLIQKANQAINAASQGQTPSSDDLADDTTVNADGTKITTEKTQSGFGDVSNIGSTWDQWQSRLNNSGNRNDS